MGVCPPKRFLKAFSDGAGALYQAVILCPLLKVTRVESTRFSLAACNSVYIFSLITVSAVYNVRFIYFLVEM
ncbi:MAG: hypothetical protein RSB97_07335, partial [Christensenella sp.]